jgi:hypothetical protein
MIRHPVRSASLSHCGHRPGKNASETADDYRDMSSHYPHLKFDDQKQLTEKW